MAVLVITVRLDVAEVVDTLTQAQITTHPVGPRLDRRVMGESRAPTTEMLQETQSSLLAITAILLNLCICMLVRPKCVMELLLQVVQRLVEWATQEMLAAKPVTYIQKQSLMGAVQTLSLCGHVVETLVTKVILHS